MPLARPPYRRVQAPIYHRPTSWFSHGLRRIGSVVSQVGLRSYSDDRMKTGRLLEMDVFLPDGETVTALVEVEWCDPLPAADPPGSTWGCESSRSIRARRCSSRPCSRRPDAARPSATSNRRPSRVQVLVRQGGDRSHLPAPPLADQLVAHPHVGDEVRSVRFPGPRVPIAVAPALPGLDGGGVPARGRARHLEGLDLALEDQLPRRLQIDEDLHPAHLLGRGQPGERRSVAPGVGADQRVVVLPDRLRGLGRGALAGGEQDHRREDEAAHQLPTM